MKGSCKDIESAATESRQGLVLQLGGWANNCFIVKNKHVTNSLQEPWTWSESLDKRPKRQGSDGRALALNQQKNTHFSMERGI
jgi:hypothetical protein